MMRGSFISSQIRRGNRNLLLVNLVLIALLLLVASFNFNSYYNLLCGPFEMSMASVEAIKSAGELNKSHIKISGVQVFDAGLQYVSYTYEAGTDKIVSTTVEAEYQYLVLSDKILLVETGPGETPTLTYSGILKPMPQGLQEALIEDDGEVTPEEFDELVLPFYLQTRFKKTGSYIKLAIWSLILLFALRNIVLFTLRTADRSRHPVYRALARHGDPGVVSDEIDEEIETEGLQTYKSLFLSKSWLIRKSFFGLHLVPFEDILWMYKNVTRQRVNFIPAGRTYSLRICPKDRNCWMLTMKENEVDAALTVIGEKATNAIIGYSDELKYLWDRNFPAFVEATKNKGA